MSTPDMTISFRISPFLWMHPARCEDLLALAAEYRDTLDEVAFFTSFTHPPLPLETITERAEMLQTLIPRFKALGMSAGINHLSTLGHHNENLEHSLRTAWQRQMDINGVTVEGAFCPLDPGFRQYVAESYVALAKAKPDFIWIDDDVRLHGHGKVQHACFCPRCLRAFARETDVTWTREELCKAFNDGDSWVRLQWRMRWLAHNRGVITDLLALIRAVVDRVDPALPVGLMTGEDHYDGFGYAEWLGVLAGERQVPTMLRPGGGFYSDDAPIALLGKAHGIGRQIAPLPATVMKIQSEIENFPYQRLKKSTTTLALEVGAYIAAGCTGAALNICGGSADPLDEYHPIFARVRAMRPFFAQAVETFGRSACEGIWQGISMSDYATLRMNDDWFAAPSWHIPNTFSELAEIGLPIAYGRDGAAMTMLADNSCMAFPREELMRILAGGVICDARALRRLTEMGFAELLGFATAGAYEVDTIEALTGDPLNGDFAGWQRDCRQSFWPETASVLEPVATGARVLAEGIDYAGMPLGPMMGAFENRLGGRIVACGYYPWYSLHTLAKTSQLKALCRWLTRDRLPAYLASYHKVPLWVRRDAEGHPALFLINASLDPADGAELAIRDAGDAFTLIRTDGSTTALTPTRRDDAYAFYTLDHLAPWEMVIVRR